MHNHRRGTYIPSADNWGKERKGNDNSSDSPLQPVETRYKGVCTKVCHLKKKMSDCFLYKCILKRKCTSQKDVLDSMWLLWHEECPEVDIESRMLLIWERVFICFWELGSWILLFVALRAFNCRSPVEAKLYAETVF